MDAYLLLHRDNAFCLWYPMSSDLDTYGIMCLRSKSDGLPQACSSPSHLSYAFICAIELQLELACRHRYVRTPCPALGIRSKLLVPCQPRQRFALLCEGMEDFASAATSACKALRETVLYMADLFIMSASLRADQDCSFLESGQQDCRQLGPAGEGQLARFEPRAEEPYWPRPTRGNGRFVLLLLSGGASAG